MRRQGTVRWPRNNHHSPDSLETCSTDIGLELVSDDRVVGMGHRVIMGA